MAGPLTLTNTVASGATLGTYTELYAAMAALSGLQGLWVADSNMLTVSGGKASSMAAKAGTGTFDQASGSLQPAVATRTSKGVLRCTGAEAMGLTGLTIGTTSSCTVAFGGYISDTTDAQNLFGAQGSPVWRAAFRNNPSGTMFFRADSGADVDTSTASDLTGWFWVIMTQGGGSTRIKRSGTAAFTAPASNVSALLPTFAIGSASSAVGSFRGDIRCCAIFNVDKSSSGDIATIETWLDIETTRL